MLTMLIHSSKSKFNGKENNLFPPDAIISRYNHLNSSMHLVVHIVQLYCDEIRQNSSYVKWILGSNIIRLLSILYRK